MPSVHQHGGASDTGFEDEATKMVATKDLSTLDALARGMDTDAIHEHIQAAVELDPDDCRAGRLEVVGLLNRHLNERG